MADIHTHIHKQSDLPYLVIHAVYPVWPQQINGLANEICASAVEHPETQVEVEFVCCSFGVQTFEGAKATLRPNSDKQRDRETK